MASLTTFRIGGPCGILFTASNPETAALLLRCCAEEEVPLLILGNSSNLLVSDKGIPGAVLRLFLIHILSKSKGNFKEVFKVSSLYGILCPGPLCRRHKRCEKSLGLEPSLRAGSLYAYGIIKVGRNARAFFGNAADRR